MISLFFGESVRLTVRKKAKWEHEMEKRKEIYIVHRWAHTHTHTQTGGKRIQFITNNDLVTIRICEHPSGNIHPTSTTIDDDEDGHINSESSLLNIVCCLMMIVIVDLEEKRKYTTQRAHTHTHTVKRHDWRRKPTRNNYGM